MYKIYIPKHMHQILKNSGKWVWGENFFFDCIPSFTLKEDGRNEIKLKLTEESIKKRELIDELGLDYN